MAENLEASKTVNPQLEDINLGSLAKQINKSAEAIAKEHFAANQTHAATQSIADVLDTANTAMKEGLIAQEADTFAKEEHPIDTEETAQSLKENTKDIAREYQEQLQRQIPYGRPLSLEEARQAKEEAYKKVKI